MWQYFHVYNEMSLEWAPSVDMKFIYGSFIAYTLGLKVILDSILIILVSFTSVNY